MAFKSIIYGIVFLLTVLSTFPLIAAELSYQELNAQALEYSRQGDFENTVKLLEKAIATYEQGTQSDETKGEYYVMRANLGTAYMRLGEVEKGKTIIKQANDEFTAFLEKFKK